MREKKVTKYREHFISLPKAHQVQKSQVPIQIPGSQENSSLWGLDNVWEGREKLQNSESEATENLFSLLLKS